MQNIEDFNKYNLTTALDYLKKYIDFTIDESKQDLIYEALNTVYVEEIIFFLEQYNIGDFRYNDKKFMKTLSLYLNEEIKNYIESQGYKSNDSYFMQEKFEDIILN